MLVMKKGVERVLVRTASEKKEEGIEGIEHGTLYQTSGH